MAEPIFNIRVEPYADTFEVIVEQLRETEATHAQVRVFYRGYLKAEMPIDEGVDFKVIRSDQDVISLLGRGVLMATKSFAFGADMIEFVRIELFRSVGREEHRP